MATAIPMAASPANTLGIDGPCDVSDFHSCGCCMFQLTPLTVVRDPFDLGGGAPPPGTAGFDAISSE
jgi:hypothetical protein